MNERYRANYAQIASDHLDHWRQTGENPWQSKEHVATVSRATLGLVHRYSKPGAAVLDAGCAIGDLLLKIKGRDRYGCDFTPAYVEIAQQRGLSVIQADLESLPYPDGQFDMVLAIDVLEHVLDLNAVVGSLLRVLRVGGVLVVRSPDEEDLTPYLGSDNPYYYVHLRRFDEASFRLLFTRIFDCEVLETSVVLRERMVAVRKAS